jgi:23S rRNA (guanine2445-N2)-methyltransferase / 23S rRNA (guanine2069-N7)-methyltransferase
MSAVPDKLDLIAVSAFGLEGVVARELRDLGYPDAAPCQTGRICFCAGPEAVCRANIFLRCADRVLIRVGSFSAPDFESLFEGTKELEWERWIGRDAAFPVSGRSVRSTLTSVPAVQRTVKKAIVERLRSAHATTELPETGPEVAVEVALLKDQVTITIDTTGPALNKRGYRDRVVTGQLRETLAAALVQLSVWTPDRPLVDPFCGSGTIPIEAALIARRIAPGLHRTFASDQWPWIPDTLWDAADEEARDLILAAPDVSIIGTDIDEPVLALARRHAERAGVADLIHFQQRDFADLRSKREHGCVIANPPYALRLGDDRDVRSLYQQFPAVLARMPSWSHFVLTAFPDFERIVEREADRRRKLFNARIECTYYQFLGPKPPSMNRADPEAPRPEVAPVFGGADDKARKQAESLAACLTRRARHMRRWPERQGITCYRLYDNNVPGVRLAIDRYEDHLHIGEYEPRDGRSPGAHAAWLDLMIAATSRALDVHPSKIHVKRRDRQRADAQHEKLDDQGARGRRFTVSEGGHRFIVNLTDYIDTGLFLDHRQTRAMVAAEAEGKRVLNLFAYTGSFTVYAAAAGARSTTSVDWSNTYLDWAHDNLALNDLDAPEHTLVRKDVLAFLEGHLRAPAYDLAVVDPPTFSNSKRTDEIWDVQRDHARLLSALAPLMTPGAAVYFSTNARRFTLDEPALDAYSIREITRRTTPPDFADSRAHRCWRLVRTA